MSVKTQKELDTEKLQMLQTKILECRYIFQLPWVRAFGFTRARRGKGKKNLGNCKFCSANHSRDHAIC